MIEFAGLLKPVGDRQRLAEFIKHFLELVHITIILSPDIQDFLFDTAEESDGIVPCFFPQIHIQATEKIASIGIPSPPEIIGEFS